MLIENKIVNKLTENLKPIYLKVTNESAMHHGHNGQESHFKIDIVSEQFENLSTLKRHRLVQNILKNEIALIKAFSLHPYTEEEWLQRHQTFNRSPTCRGIDES